MLLTYWHWLALGLGMVAAEVMVPGAFFLWIGLAAFLLAGVVFLDPLLTVSSQLVLFGVLAPLVTIIGRKAWRPFSLPKDAAFLNRRGQQLLGEVITLDTPIIHGHAHVTVGDSKWRVKGPDLPAGVDVQIVGIDGNRLIVVPVTP